MQARLLRRHLRIWLPIWASCGLLVTKRGGRGEEERKGEEETLLFLFPPTTLRVLAELVSNPPKAAPVHVFVRCLRRRLHASICGNLSHGQLLQVFLGDVY